MTPPWAPCSGPAAPTGHTTGYQCASVPVLRDPKDASKGTIQMALDRHPATGTKIGSLLINPGGPGVSGVDFLPNAVALLAGSPLLTHFDLVGFDPPGVGRTAPIVCLDPPGLAQWFHLDPDPPTAAGLQAVIAEDRVFASGCEQRSKDELPFVSTVDAAMDMDAIRADVGDPKLSYLGFSYGTFLGATYAGLYPTHIRAMVLDGAIDPSLSMLATLDSQSAAIDATMKQIFSSCTGSASCPWKPGSDPVGAFLALENRVRQSPVAVGGSGRTVGPAEVLYGAGDAVYSPSLWSFLEKALASLTRGDGQQMLDLFDTYVGRRADGTYSNEFEANTAVTCLDAPAPSIDAIEANAAVAEQSAPIWGAADVLSALNCAVWPVPPTGQPHQIHATGSPPIVVVGSTGDPATPYSGAQALASQLSNAVLITRVGYGHTGYPFSSCVRNAVNSYLVGLTVPAAGTRCATG